MARQVEIEWAASQQPVKAHQQQQRQQQQQQRSTRCDCMFVQSATASMAFIVSTLYLLCSTFLQTTISVSAAACHCL